MKRIVLIITSFFFCIISIAQTTLKGIIKDKDGNGVPNVSIFVTGKKSATVTNEIGEFSIAAKAGDQISISFVGFTTTEITVSAEHIKTGLVFNIDSGLVINSISGLGGGSQSPKSYWIGAKVGYNFDGFSEDDLDNYFIGAAKVILNKSKDEFLKGEWGVVGNIAGFISNQNKKDANKDLEKIALSVQGLGVGLYEIWEQKAGKKNVIREYLTGGYRLNTFKKVGKDSVTVNLSQFKISGGFEFEALTFEKGGTLNFSFELTHLRFSSNKYNTIFGKEKSSLTSFEIGAILPINSNFGFFASGTFAPDMKPVYLFGVIVKSDSK
jgi:hypothetical protein